MTDLRDSLRARGLELVGQIDDGGMSTVWRVWDAAAARSFAVKVLKDEFLDNTDEVRHFQEESALMAEIRHPGVVEAYGCEQTAGGRWYSVLEFVDGYAFGALLRRKQRISESDCLLICESVAAALDVVWNDHGVVHCDIKPENIMINTAGVVKLTDLGISHRFEFREGPQTVPEHVQGTPAYISPEQVYGDVELDCRSDIYSLGATLYHLATGRVLFPGLDTEQSMRAHCDENRQARDPRAYRPSLSKGFCQLLEAMLVKNRDARLSSWMLVSGLCRDIENGVAFKSRAETGSHSSVALSFVI